MKTGTTSSTCKGEVPEITLHVGTGAGDEESMIEWSNVFFGDAR